MEKFELNASTRIFVPSEDKAFGLFFDDLLLSSEPQYHQL
jgi:hypothetical protein